MVFCNQCNPPTWHDEGLLGVHEELMHGEGVERSQRCDSCETADYQRDVTSPTSGASSVYWNPANPAASSQGGVQPSWSQFSVVPYPPQQLAAAWHQPSVPGPFPNGIPPRVGGLPPTATVTGAGGSATTTTQPAQLACGFLSTGNFGPFGSVAHWTERPVANMVGNPRVGAIRPPWQVAGHLATSPLLRLGHWITP